MDNGIGVVSEMSASPKVKATNTELEIRLYDALRRIARYMTPDQIRRDAEKGGIGLLYEEYLEMSYENIQAEAKRATQGMRMKRP